MATAANPLPSWHRECGAGWLASQRSPTAIPRATMPLLRHRTGPLLLSALLLAACDNEPEAALQVGDLGFLPDQVSGFDGAQIHSLGDIAALAAAVRDSVTESLVRPLAERVAARELLAVLPLEIAARAMQIDSAALRAAYEANPEVQLSVRHVVRLAPAWAASAERAEARRTAEEVQRRAAAGEPFPALAAEFSEEPGAAERGGLLEPGRAGSWVEPFWAAAASLAEGEASPVVETQYGFHVLKLERREPAPFADADRDRLLRQLVPAARAASEMQAWAATRAATLTLIPPAVAAARKLYEQGTAPDTLVLAEWPGGRYTARDFALDAALERTVAPAGPDRLDDAAWGAGVQSQAIDAMWMDAAEAFGSQRSAAAFEEAQREWQTHVARWRGAFGLGGGLTADQVRAAVLAALNSRAQEARIARSELAALRPLLRERYPLSGPAAPSSSPAVNSDSTR